MRTDQHPPHCPESEKAAIGCALADPTLAPELRPDWFYDLRNRTMAEALMQFAREGKAIGTDTIAQHLIAGGLEDAAALVMACADACHSPANWPYWREQLTEALIGRRIIATAQEAILRVQTGDSTPLDQLEAFERDALAIRQEANGGGTGEVDLRATLLELTNEYEMAATQGRPTGLATGFADLDRLIGGLKAQQLAIIAARPSVGKTALALNIAEHVALNDRLPVGFFSLEMSSKELVHRLTCSRARVDGTRLNEGRATESERRALVVAHGQVAKAPLHICDRGGLTLAQLAAHARRITQRHGIKLLIVDYLGLLRSGEKGRGRYEETTLISNGLKTLAKDLNLPLIALAQLNRDTERDGRAPRLSDLRDSGAIEQDADIVALLHRDENQTGDSQVVNLILAKQRNGRTGKVELIFRRAFTRFESATRG